MLPTIFSSVRVQKRLTKFRNINLTTVIIIESAECFRKLRGSGETGQRTCDGLQIYWHGEWMRRRWWEEL